ncbi:MAG: hypothetical protein ACYCSN_14650 [Acidobacteriaceae bacterium]
MRRAVALIVTAMLLCVSASQVSAHAPKQRANGWSCTLPMYPTLVSDFTVTVYVGHAFWSTGQQFVVDTGDGAAPVVLSEQAAASLHLHGRYVQGVAVGIGGSGAGYYTSVMVNLCGRVFDGQQAIVLAPVAVPAPTSLDAPIEFNPCLIGAPFLWNNGLSVTVNPVSDTVQFVQVSHAAA